MAEDGTIGWKEKCVEEDREEGTQDEARPCSCSAMKETTVFLTPWPVPGCPAWKVSATAAEEHKAKHTEPLIKWKKTQICPSA